MHLDNKLWKLEMHLDNKLNLLPLFSQHQGIPHQKSELTFFDFRN
jgi:hypothetical protein